MSQLLTSNNQQSSYAATWNDAATVFTAWKLNVTDTASDATSILMDLQVGGTSVMKLEKGGGLTLAGQFRSTTSAFAWGSGSNVAFIFRDAAGILAQRNGTNTQAFRVYRTYTDSSNYEALELAHATYSSAQYSILRTITAGTGADNINLVLSPSGTGAILAQVPDGATGGGNARGVDAADFQKARNAATQVASGQASFCAGERNTASGAWSVAAGFTNTASTLYCTAFGNGNTASSNAATSFGQANTSSGLYSVTGGFGCTASDNSAVAFGAYNRSSAANSFSSGRYALANKWGQNAHAASNFAAEGDAQRSVLVMRNATTDATVTELFLDGTSLRATIPNNTLWHADIRIAARQATGTNHAIYHRKCAIYKNTTAGSTALQGTVQTIGTDVESDANWDVTVSADTTNGSLKIEVTGVAATNIRWVAEVSLVEVAYA